MKKRITVLALILSYIICMMPFTAAFSMISSENPEGYFNNINEEPQSTDEIGTQEDITYQSSAAAANNNTIKIAGITNYSIPIKSSANTNGLIGNWARISPISQFVDNNGRLGFAYDDDDNVYIEKLNSSMSTTVTLTIPKKYDLVGAVTCDNKGFYYIVWGQDDAAGKGGVETIAVSKYDNNGKFIKTAAIVSSGGGGLGDNETQSPFSSGNCAVTIYDNILVCSYARGMYNGHQSNAIIAVNTADMSLRTDIYAYTSHSFDQRVIYHKGLKQFIFADHGDAYPRGFNISLSGFNNFVPFRFYEEPHYWDDMYILNRTNAQLGGIGEVSTGLALAGSSAKSYSSKFFDEKKQLFIQIFNPATRKFQTSGTRKDANGNVIDTGVKWLTNYKDASAENPQMIVTDDNRIVVMWEKCGAYGSFEQSYFMIISARGDILLEATPMPNNIRLNAFEEPWYINGYVYWITANGTTATVNKMSLVPVELPYISNSGWEKINGYWYYGRNNIPVMNEWVSSSGKWYYLKSDGKMAAGEWVTWNGNTYYMSAGGAMITGWVKTGDNWYYHKSSGAMAVNEWLKWNEKWYYLKSDGKMAANESITYKEKDYNFNESGACTNP